MRFPLYIAQRYLKSKSGNNIINIVTLVACLGVMAGTTALFIVLSVFSGIKNYSLNILDHNTPDIRITAIKGKTFLVDREFNHQLKKAPVKIIYTKILEERAFFKHSNKEEIAFIKGVDSLFNQVTPLDSLIIVGNWFVAKSTNSCIVDYQLTRKLELNVYTDLLQAYVPKPGKGYVNNIKNIFKSVRPQVVGVIATQNQESNKYVYVPLTLSQQLLSKQNNEVSAVDIAVENPKKIDEVTKYLKNTFPQHKIAKKTEINSSFYKILNSEKLVAYLVSLLVVIMVLSNTSGTIIMVIVDKKNNIKTLLNIGTTLKKVRRIFAWYGFLLNLLGMSIGLILGLLIIYLQTNYQIIMITPTVAYPVAFEWQNLWVVCFTIVAFGSLASLLASNSISKKFINKR